MIGCGSERWAGIIRTLAGAHETNCQEDGGIVTFTVTTDRASDPSVLGISVASAGRLLSDAVYRAAYDATDEAERRRDFPEVGARSMVEQVSVGPGGAAVSILSTTIEKAVVEDEIEPVVGICTEKAAHQRLYQERPDDPWQAKAQCACRTVSGVRKCSSGCLDLLRRRTHSFQVSCAGLG